MDQLKFNKAAAKWFMTKYYSHDVRQTEVLAKLMVQKLTSGKILSLQGNLGSGKTTFIKSLAKALGVKQTITSPTFVLMKVYQAKKGKIKQFVHVDCYRLPTGKHCVPEVELTHLGLDDYLKDTHTITAIEWAEKIKLKKYRPLIIKFKYGKKKNERIISYY